MSLWCFDTRQLAANTKHSQTCCEGSGASIYQSPVHYQNVTLFKPWDAGSLSKMKIYGKIWMCHDVDTQVIMQSHYFRRAAVIRAGLHWHSAIAATTIPVEHYCCNTHVMSLSSTAGTRTAAAAAAAPLKQMSLNWNSPFPPETKAQEFVFESVIQVNVRRRKKLVCL